MEIIQSSRWLMQWKFFKLIPDLSRGNLTDLGFGLLLVATLSSGLFWCMYVYVRIFECIYVSWLQLIWYIIYANMHLFPVLFMVVFSIIECNSMQFSQKIKKINNKSKEMYFKSNLSSFYFHRPSKFQISILQKTRVQIWCKWM